jgi:hypothetical protein
MKERTHQQSPCSWKADWEREERKLTRFPFLILSDPALLRRKLLCQKVIAKQNLIINE